jgi:hypothetical protein
MNRRTFLASLPLIPAALHSLTDVAPVWRMETLSDGNFLVTEYKGYSLHYRWDTLQTNRKHFGISTHDELVKQRKIFEQWVDEGAPKPRWRPIKT